MLTLKKMFYLIVFKTLIEKFLSLTFQTSFNFYRALNRNNSVGLKT